MRSIKHIIPAQKVNMGGHYLDQPLPTQQIGYLDPFLLIHHWDNILPGNQQNKDVGVGPHPHRGFSPVTFVFEGNVEHRDSRDHFAQVSSGGTQWMFAGRGITHSERMGDELAEKGGKVEFIQFWVNAPAAHKMEEPYYKPISKEETPTFLEDGVEIAVVAGEYQEMKGVAPTFSPQTLLRGSIAQGKQHTFKIPQAYNTLLYILDGSAIINGATPIKGKDMVVFDNNDESFDFESAADTRFILLSGEPLNESVASHGPFVMNTESEIMEAFRDAQMGKMGILIEEF